MNRIGWWLVHQASRLLKSNQREAVLGDIAESGESAEIALYEMLGLIIRQLAALRNEVRMSKPRFIASSVITFAVVVAAGWWAVNTFWLTALPGSPVHITGYVYASDRPESNSPLTFMYYMPDDAHARFWLCKSGGAQIKGPVPISMPAPRYTSQAQKDKVEGAIVALVDVDAGGNVTGVRLTAVSLSRNLTDGLDRSVIDTVRAWRFRPATKTGKPLPVTVHVHVQFSLS